MITYFIYHLSRKSDVYLKFQNSTLNLVTENISYPPSNDNKSSDTTELLDKNKSDKTEEQPNNKINAVLNNCECENKKENKN